MRKQLPVVIKTQLVKQNVVHLSICWVEVLEIHVHETKDKTTIHERERFLHK